MNPILHLILDRLTREVLHFRYIIQYGMISVKDGPYEIAFIAEIDGGITIIKYSADMVKQEFNLADNIDTITEIITIFKNL